MATIFKQILKQSLTNRSNLHIKSTLFLDSSNTTNTVEASTILNKDTLKKLISTNKVVIFMKGNPESPRCGFSNAVVQILRMHGVQYDAHDVLKSEELRQGIKEYTDWPTIPQIFINGVFIGGCDILLQMHQSGDLIEELKKVGIESLLLKEKLNQVKDNKKDAKKDS